MADVDRVHELKCWPEYYQAMVDGLKPFEARKNDRGFEVGDMLWIREWDHGQGEYTGRDGRWEVTYVLHGPAFGIEDGFCIMGLK